MKTSLEQEADFGLSSCIFVYGTLRPDASNAHRLKGAKHLGQAKVRGKLYRISWYPGLVLDAMAESVYGDLFVLSDPEMLARLDDYEGSEYRRKLIEIEKIKVWVWEYALTVNGLHHIENGDWLDVQG